MGFAEQAGFDAIAAAAFSQAPSVLGPSGSHYAATMYDTVWSAAAGIAAAAVAKGDRSAPVRGDDLAALFKGGGYPAFNGMYGRRRYLNNGDWDMSRSHVEISNYGMPSGASEPRVAIVATVELQAYNVTVAEGERIVWSSGREYPYVGDAAGDAVMDQLRQLMSGGISWRRTCCADSPSLRLFLMAGASGPHQDTDMAAACAHCVLGGGGPAGRPERVPHRAQQVPERARGGAGEQGGALLWPR